MLADEAVNATLQTSTSDARAFPYRVNGVVSVDASVFEARSPG